MNDIKICVLGGDLRMLSAIDALCKNNCTVKYFGINNTLKNAIKCTTLKEAVSGTDVIILPLPFSVDGIRIFSPLGNEDIRLDLLLSLVRDNKLIAGGKLSESFCKKAKESGCTVYDYCNSERLSILNAVPTAEGALAIAMNETDKTIFGSKCAVMGYGRIGRVLSRLLKNMGADTTVFARSEQAVTWAEVEGCNAFYLDQAYKEIQKTDIIFNTIPAVVLDKKTLSNTKENVTIIDLASSPGGVDTECAKALSRKVIFALSLPGKVAPVTSGNIIADCILSKIKGGYV